MTVLFGFLNLLELVHFETFVREGFLNGEHVIFFDLEKT